MKWRCEWCGKPHEENDPPCDNCGHGTFEEAVTQVNHEVVEGGPRWVCLDCGRQHQKNSPPCNRCGGSNFERRTGPPEDDPLDEIKTGWLDVLEAKYVLGYVTVALVIGIVLLGLVAGVPLPGFQSETPAGPPPIPDAPGQADTVNSLSLAEVEDIYVEVYNVRRSSISGGTVTRNATADDAATYYNRGRVAAHYENADPPTRDGVSRFALSCDRPATVHYEVAYDRTPMSVEQFGNETAFATALVDSYFERGQPVRQTDDRTIGVDVHVGPDGRVFVTHVLC
ncbi:hypothetical protein ACOZ4I_10585 [Haloarcula salina]|uniref:hypothetical protein n=1 Tax=Haloarcula salina TaxID=1429914 RepID=UPI003C702118